VSRIAAALAGLFGLVFVGRGLAPFATAGATARALFVSLDRKFGSPLCPTIGMFYLFLPLNGSA
jgi:hypothetical protein